LVTFMALLFWIATWLTIQIVCEPFRPGNTDLEVSTSYLADNLNLSACFRRRRPESERDRSYRPLTCVSEINAAMRTPQKPGGPVFKKKLFSDRGAGGARASIGTSVAPTVFKARICRLLPSRHTNKAGL
jgi:hypothetical protein